MRADSTRSMMPGAFHMDYSCPPVIVGAGGGKPHESSSSSRVSVHSTYTADRHHTAKNSGKFVSSSSTPSVPGAFSVPSTGFPSDPSIFHQQQKSKFVPIQPASSRTSFPPSSRTRSFAPQQQQQQQARSSSSALKQQQHQRSVPKKRRVRIQEARNEWFPSNLQWEDAINIWYQKADYADFHARMVTAVMTVAQSNDDSARTVLHRLLRASLKAKSENEELFLSHEETRRFQNLYRTYPDLVGLERNVCYPMSKDRSQRKESLVEIVEDMQSFGWPSPEVEAQKVAEASIKASLPSRLVARCLALGVAVPQEEPQREQRKSSSLMQQHSAAHSQDQMVEISPGLAVRLRGAAETRACIEQDFFMPVKCLSCSLDIFCIQDASYVLCPLCRVVSPLEDEHENSYGEGLGLGFTMESLEAIQKEMMIKSTTSQRRGSH